MVEADSTAIITGKAAAQVASRIVKAYKLVKGADYWWYRDLSDGVYGLSNIMMEIFAKNGLDREESANCSAVRHFIRKLVAEDHGFTYEVYCHAYSIPTRL